MPRILPARIVPALLLLVLSGPVPAHGQLMDSARSRLSQIEGNLQVAGLDSAVEVRRDRWAEERREVRRDRRSDARQADRQAQRRIERTAQQRNVQQAARERLRAQARQEARRDARRDKREELRKEAQRKRGNNRHVSDD